jgi:hypothetical protein
MGKVMRTVKAAALAATIAVLFLAGLASDKVIDKASAYQTVPKFSHFVIILIENKEFGDLGRTSDPAVSLILQPWQGH